MRDALGDKFVLLFRTHYFISNYIDLSEFEGFVYNVSRHNDINELYIISDMLITDYSSVFFDFANLKRPIIFYMYDYDSYKTKLRDFYIDVSTLPGPIVKTQDELQSAIASYKENAPLYKDKYTAFLEKFCPKDDGFAAKRVVDYCIEHN